MANIDKINVNGVDYNIVDSTSGYITASFDSTALWSNSSPGSSFSGQTISNLSLSGYSFYLVRFRYYYTTDGNYIWAIARSGEQTLVFAPFHRNYKRDFTINSTSVTFGDCAYFGTYASNTETTSNNNLIPQAIYGVK